MSEEYIPSMPEYYDHYDFDKMEKIREKREKRYFQLIKNWAKAKESGDKEKMRKAFKALDSHRNQNEKIKEKCSESGFYWY